MGGLQSWLDCAADSRLGATIYLHRNSEGDSMATLASDPTTSRPTSRPIVVVETAEEGNAESIPQTEAVVAFLETVIAEATTQQASWGNIKQAASDLLSALTATPRRGPISD